MKQKIFLIIFIIVLASCKTTTTMYEYNDIQKSPLLVMDGVKGEFEFIALDDTTNESVLQDVWNVKISENYIFVLSAIDGVFQFDRKGHFVKKISSKGNGPGEWNVVIDIAVDESNDKIYIYDYTGKLMCFSIATGEYSGQFMVPGKMFSKADIKDDKFLIAPYNSMGDKESMVYCLDLSNSNIIETGELAQFVLTDYSKMLYSFTKGIVPNDGAVLLHPNLSDTVYEYIPGHNYVTQKFAVSFNNPLTPQLRSMGYDGLQKAQTIKDIAQNEHYYFVEICDSGVKGEWYAFCKENDETYKLALKYAPDNNLKFSPRYQSGNLMADIIHTSSLEENSPELTYISKRVGREVTVESNPVIVIWNE